MLYFTLYRFTSFVLVGDFNINFCNKDHPYFCRLQSILQSFSLSQVVHSPTHINSNGHASLIDLALVSSKTQLLDYSVIPPLANGDHNSLELFFKWKHCDKQVRITPRTIWRYKEADYRKACQMINETDWDDLLHEDDVDCSATSMSPNISMNATHYPTNNGASSLASQQLQLSSLLLMIGFKHLRLDKKCVPSFLI